MTANNSSVLEGGHLAGLAVVRVWEGPIIWHQARASVFLDEADHGGPEGFVRQCGRRPELPICRRKYQG